MDNIETQKAVAQAGATIGHPAAVFEGGETHGTYSAVMAGPVEAYRERYITLRDMINQAEQADALESVRELIKEFRAIPIEEKWRDTILNLVVTVGRNDMLDKHLSGSSYTATWFIGLIGATSYTTGPAAGDTAATHGGWVEFTGYSQGARPATAWNAANSGSKALSSALTFSITSTETVKGCFLISNSTKGGTTGILFSAGLFTGGDQPLVNGNTLNVSYTASLT